ncbi:MAG: GntR family transcriptional regulator [Desulfovibrionaceae bacterium]
MLKAPIKSQIACDIIRDLILSGKKRPGEHLTLAELEREVGIGRGPIREAFMRLDRSGLVRNLPHRGIVVAVPPTMEEVHHIFEVRLKVEGILCHEAMRYATKENFRELEKILAGMHDFSKSNFIPLDRKFHAELYAIARLPYLSQTAEKVLESVEIYLRAYLPTPHVCMDSLEEHYTMLQAMHNKDADLLQNTLAKNLQHGIDTIQQGYKDTLFASKE